MVEPKNLHINNAVFEEAKSIFGSGDFRYWIGVTNGGDYKYQSDGSSVTWEMPFNGSKKDSFSSTDCLYIYSSGAGMWYTMTCTNTIHVYTVCEVETD